MISMIPEASATVIEYWTEGEDVESIAVSADGRYAVASIDDEHLYLLDSSGDIVWRNDFPSPFVGAVAISGDGGLILAAYRGGIQLLDGSGGLIWEKDLDATVWDVAISSSGTHVAATLSPTGAQEYNLCLFDRSGNELWRYRLGGSSYTVSISSNGDYVAAGSFDQHVYFFDKNGNLLWNYGTGSTVGSVSVSPDGDYVAACAYSLYFFDKNGELLWGGEEARETWGSDTVSVSAGGNYIAVSDSKDIILYDSNGKQLWSFTVAEEKSVEDIAISANGELIAAATRTTVVPGFGLIYLLENPPGDVVIRKPSIGRPSTITCWTSPSSALIGSTITVSGRIDPPHAGVKVTLTYKKPDGNIVTKEVLTDSDSSYKDVLTPDQIGWWQANASWTGSEEYSGSTTSSGFYMDIVEERGEVQSLQPGDRVKMEVGEKCTFHTYKSGQMWYDYKVDECPGFIKYGGSFTYVIGGSSYITSTVRVMPYAELGVHKIEVEYGWGGPVGKVDYTYDLTFEVEVLPPPNKYNTSISISAADKVTTVDVTGRAYIDIKGYLTAFPGLEVTLQYKKPDGTEFTRTTTAQEGGTFQDAFAADAQGMWSVTARWDGDPVRNGATSETVSFMITATPPSTTTTAPISKVTSTPSRTLTTTSPSTVTPEPLTFLSVVIVVLAVAGVLGLILLRARRPTVPKPVAPI